MKLISESPQEDRLIPGVAALLIDLGIDADGYLQKDSFAATFLSSNDLELLECDFTTHMNEDEMAFFLQSIEDSLRAAMYDAAIRTTEKALRHINQGTWRLSTRQSSS